MTTMYSTITSNGQITLPSVLRRKFALESGLRVILREVDGRIVVEPPPNLAAMRARVKREMVEAGTWGSVIQPPGGGGHKEREWIAADEGRVGGYDG